MVSLLLGSPKVRSHIYKSCLCCGCSCCCCCVQGKLLKLLAKKVEFCYAPPSISPLYVSKTAAYSTGMQPGSASWNFFKTAQLAAPFTNNIASLFRGDTAVSGAK